VVRLVSPIFHHKLPEPATPAKPPRRQRREKPRSMTDRQTRDNHEVKYIGDPLPSGSAHITPSKAMHALPSKARDSLMHALPSKARDSLCPQRPCTHCPQRPVTHSCTRCPQRPVTHSALKGPCCPANFHNQLAAANRCQTGPELASPLAMSADHTDSVTVPAAQEPAGNIVRVMRAVLAALCSTV
jgi:hypothetical protein